MGKVYRERILFWLSPTWCCCVENTAELQDDLLLHCAVDRRKMFEDTGSAKDHR